MNENTEDKQAVDFIREIVAEDLKSGKHKSIITRFPPEPNGQLHIGHAKALCIDFGIAKEFDGVCNLRFDDTNPAKEETEYVEAIKNDIRWLGFDWGDRLFFASDYFEKLYDYAVELVKAGKAYVCELSAEETREYRGTLTEPGKNSPWRDRPVEENLDLFEQMKNGEFQDGTKVLRAKIDMASPNLNLRDPVMYRISHKAHHRTGDTWCIYPMYDWAHGLEDSIEGVTHSLCSLEYENHRPLYDWFLEQLPVYRPRQIEFSRLNLTYTIMSKRHLSRLVDEKVVSGWDDPRMPTLSGMRRRGYPAEAIREFCHRVGVTKFDSVSDIALLEHCVRDVLNRTANRYMAVLDPLKVVIENYPEGQEEELEAVNNPEDPDAGSRIVSFSKELYIERDDFREEAPRKFRRLKPGTEVRLRYAYFITCKEVIKNQNGEIVELRCEYDPATKGGSAPDGRKVKGTLHWVSAKHAVDTEVRLYDRLFTDPAPAGKGRDYMDCLNPDSLKVITAKVEPALLHEESGETVQFERQGYFCADIDSSAEKPVYNQTTPLRDTWAKMQKTGKSA